MPFAQVVFNLPLFHAYTYRIPAALENVEPGSRVLVPFGKRTLTGIVVEINVRSNYSSVKDIIDLLDEKPLISGPMLKLTQWVAEYYFSGWGQAVQLALPKGIERQDRQTVHLLKEDPHIKLTEKQKDLYLLIGEHPNNARSFYRKKYGYQSFHYFLNKLQQKGLIAIERRVPKAKIKALSRKFILINRQYNQKKAAYSDFLKYIKRRPEVDRFMQEHSGREMLVSEFLKRTKMAGATLNKMAAYGLCRLLEKEVERKPQFNYVEKEKNIILTKEQRSAISGLKEQLSSEAFSVSLLHGVTGSGKTQVYIEILKEVIAKGKSGVILIPEISLTPQTVFRFQSAFKERIAVFHSKMSAGERYDAWMACYRGEVGIVVGPRSALFAPLQNIGLIVVDEEQGSTYKQGDTAPRYNARDVAIYWARLNQALVVLGSATPSLETYYNALSGKYRLLEIRKRVDGKKMPEVFIVDMKSKRMRIQHKISLFSEILIEKIHQRLQRGEQIILLQNRRGYSSFMQCPSCGFIPVCPNCDVALTYHSFNEQLRCHLCGFKQPAYHDCPNCGGKQIVYKGVGTQRIESELKKLLPNVHILRMDQDTTRGKNQHDHILKAFADREADILLGTQMIAKGLDFENVTLVGVISADVGLALPDFRAAERIFQLLTQVAGRSGRGSKQGEVVVQSYLPGHYAIQLARRHDFKGFYREEISFRRDYGYPPFNRLIQILISSKKMSAAIDTARSVALNLNRGAKRYGQVVGPAPASIAKMNNLYRWQVLIKLDPQSDGSGRHTKALLQEILKPFSSKKQQGLYITVDVDPQLLN